MVLLLLPAPDWATCGGGGGGGMGGMRSGGAPGMGSEQVYQVPWKILKPEDALVAWRTRCVLVPVLRTRVSEIELAQFAKPISVRDGVCHDGRRRG